VSIVEAIILGIVQGLSEFLPISSSGHLLLVPWVLGWEELDADLKRTFDVALHMGTFVGVLIYFRNDVWRLLTRDRRMGWLLALASVPAAITGAVLDSVVEDSLADEWLIGVMLIVFGAVLWWADRLPERLEEGSFGARSAVLMGLAQAAALQPGVSRSGVTMSMGRWLGFRRDAAARISFLMSLPIIAGAGLYKGFDVVSEGGIPPGMGGAFLWGTVASGVTGFIAVWGLLRLIRRTSFLPFVIYRFVVGAGVILLSGVR
jgi:undecaprenyl-diphosphatase